MENNRDKKIVITFFLSIVVAFLLGCGSLYLVLTYNPKILKIDNNTKTDITKEKKEVTITDNGIADAVEKVYDSVVIVETFKGNSMMATGSGFIYKQSGDNYYILTNYHVIEGGTKLKVKLTSNDVVDVTVVGGDKYSDVAVLSYKTSKAIDIAEMGTSEGMRVGDTVFAIGTPLDSSVYSWTVTRGIISGKDRKIEISTTDDGEFDWIMDVLQTDTAINSGNSGGPLCNSNGDVIGITSMKLINNGVEGMGFAIPIEEAVSLADSLIKGDKITRPYLGVKMADAMNKAVVQYYGLSAALEGVLITEVAAGSPAEKAGLKSGDVITYVADVQIKSVSSLRYELFKHKVGETVAIKFIRDSKVTEVKVTLESS